MISCSRWDEVGRSLSSLARVDLGAKTEFRMLNRPSNASPQVVTVGGTSWTWWPRSQWRHGALCGNQESRLGRQGPARRAPASREARVRRDRERRRTHGRRRRTNHETTPRPARTLRPMLMSSCTCTFGTLIAPVDSVAHVVASGDSLEDVRRLRIDNTIVFYGLSTHDNRENMRSDRGQLWWERDEGERRRE